jgi:hypothetical protein
VDITDPLLQNIVISEVGIFEANRYAQPDWARISIAGDSGEDSAPLLFYGTHQGQRVAVLSFQLQKSDLPLQVAFPLLVANLVNWLAPNQARTIAAGTEPFAALNVNLPQEVETVTVLPPEGNLRLERVDTPGKLLLEAVSPGIYQISWGSNQQIQAAVNFFSPEESQIKPVGNLPLLAGGSAENTEDFEPAKKIIWRPFAFAALILLLLEWFVYHRATLARLWQTSFHPKRATS